MTRATDSTDAAIIQTLCDAMEACDGEWGPGHEAEHAAARAWLADMARLRVALQDRIDDWRVMAKEWEDDDTPGGGAICLKGCARELEAVMARDPC